MTKSQQKVSKCKTPRTSASTSAAVSPRLDRAALLVGSKVPHQRGASTLLYGADVSVNCQWMVGDDQVLDSQVVHPELRVDSAITQDTSRKLSLP
jgi:hypothetical protein